MFDLQSLAVGFALALISAAVGAEEATVDTSALATGSPAMPIARPNPRYPLAALNKGAEGWVQLSYVISPAGSVSEVVVEDVVGPAAIENAAVEAVKKWTYTPATWEGKPVEQCSNQIILRFMIERDSEPGARPSQVNAYRAITRLLEEDKLDEAWEKLGKVFERDLNLYEIDIFNTQRVEVAHRKGWMATEIDLLSKAATGDEILGRKANSQVLQNLFLRRIQAKKYAQAIRTYEDLKEYSSSIDKWPAYEKAYAELVAIRDGDQQIVIDGSITSLKPGEWDFWTHRLLKRSVEFSDVQGETGNIEFRCDRKHVTDRLSAGKNWTLPESWGECAVYVFGKDGASFKLYELPAVPEPSTSGPT